ncbi:MAG: hypothetical protein JEZ00_06045 [Anaerolineaceae bacterium]|nr:hypothetical protein [Anaerolineaceae bacterium]
MQPIILKEQQIRQLCGMTIEAMQAVAEGFIQLSRGNTQVPPIMRIDFPQVEGEIDVKTAVVRGWDDFAIKIASGFFQNHILGLPNSSGLMMVFSTHNGQLQAILLDNGYLTDMRTALAGALAAKVLAPINPVVGVIGSGIQSRYQIRGLKLVRDFDEVHVYGIDPEGVQAYVRDIETESGIKAIIHQHPREVVQACNLLVTTTPARNAYLQADWLHPGLHITCMGSDAPHKQELDTQVFQQADLIACDSKLQCAEVGELHHALIQGVLPDLDRITELGDILDGKKPGRTTPQQITICDLTGVGVQDTAIARYVHQQFINQQSDNTR